MGKPFAKELEKIGDTLVWSLDQDCSDLKEEILLDQSDFPLYVVGSGGSLSACFYAALLYQQHGHMGKAITPLELYYSKNTLRKSNVLFISASGRNNDILFGYKTALEFEPNRLFSISMKSETPLSKLSEENSIGKHYEFDLPAGKDGFLATNSLIGFFSILYKTLRLEKDDIVKSVEVTDDYITDLENFIQRVDKDFTFTILYAGWGQPVAMDLESKLAEAALGDVLVSDIRNFGHGRHHWFDKRKNNSAIIALATPDERKITDKTLSFLPNDIPVLKINSNYKDGFSSIDLLVKAFYFIKAIGGIQKIDPGRPGVPDFGSKLYHLKYSSFYKTNVTGVELERQIAILRKTNAATFDHLNASTKLYWNNAYSKFKKTLNDTVFGSIIFDYDGTLCSSTNRFNGIDDEVAFELNELLKNNIVVGIATGRGKSVRVDLKKQIKEKYWKQVIVGYYNCSEIATLDNDEAPEILKEPNPILKEIHEKVVGYNFSTIVKPELRANQVTILVENKFEWKQVRLQIIQFIINLAKPNIQILESSHSLDIIDQSETFKLNIVDQCVKSAELNGFSKEFLCIGDKGKWPGNDYQLLSHKFSLSVDEVSALSDSCWNLAKAGIKNVEALRYYLSKIKLGNGQFRIEL
jgi:hydroxymethylpyrimidine pyrophosphatase-like HAD family hydrolase/fructoselysine-6-P-deglycase FrlB-like protein